MDNNLVIIDGSMGEGGGQILRTAIALSAVTGIPVKVVNIRAKRKNPGLRPQHLTAIKALVEVTSGRAKGLYVGSTSIEFYPGTIRGGNYFFDIGTAGSISLLLQAILPALAFAQEPVEATIRGGTDVKMAPTIDYMRMVFAPLLSLFGYNVDIELVRRGHYPRGGGIVKLRIRNPPKTLKPVDLTTRGTLKSIEGLSHCVKLPQHVAERQARSARAYIKSRLGIEPVIKLEFYEKGKDPHLGPGSGIALWAIFDRSIMGADALGEKGKPAEKVGEEAASKLVDDILTGASVDRFASDMLPVYMALASGTSYYSGARLTSHAETVFRLLELILGDSIRIEYSGGPNRPFKASIRGMGLTR
ncbi:MAG: RNA 3'-terminal phosphate cyclase [Desulfurococcales archaeon]|nr:RNA 3'-terminal phosphate cyclase [Desulfurococcales archaeon]